ncbi:MAG: EVE domain-containing protein [Alphaproteobacteria bacterium]|nr:EVE domain-containing protein [Alphaproteobacteria bacterium]
MKNNYWLLKSEPSTWSWDQMQQKKTTCWDGVRNFQAQKFMNQMKKGDLGFFYHSNIGKEIVGVIKVIREFYPDPTDETGRFGAVDVEAITPFKTPVSLARIKATPALHNLLLIRQSRLSVMPVENEIWEIIYKMGNEA